MRLIKAKMVADKLGDDFSFAARIDALKDDFGSLDKITDQWGFYRQMYMELIPYIMERAKFDVVTPIIPYAIDWKFSPIEEMAWCSIRCHYMALYPQFPVFNYFIDFANPYLRIGVEMDGKDYHNREKDAVRDEMLWRYGWRIFRIPGKECYLKYRSLAEIHESRFEDNEDDDREEIEWLTKSSDGLFYALKEVYFLKNVDSELYNYCLMALDYHKGAEFPLLD